MIGKIFELDFVDIAFPGFFGDDVAQTVNGMTPSSNGSAFAIVHNSPNGILVHSLEVGDISLVISCNQSAAASEVETIAGLGGRLGPVVRDPLIFGENFTHFSCLP